MKWNPFENIGLQLKGWAIVLYWLDFIGEIIAGLILLFIEGGDLAWIGLITIFGGIFFTAISTALLYGFGELIEKARDIERNTRGGEIKSETQAKVEDERIRKIENLRAQGLISEEEYKQAISKEV